LDGGGLLSPSAEGERRGRAAKSSVGSSAGGSGGAPRIALLVGDPLLVDRRLAAIQAAAGGASPAVGALGKGDGDKADAELLATAVLTLTLARPRLVVIRQAEKLREEPQKALLGLLDAVPDGTHVILTAAAIDLRRSFFAEVKARGWLERHE